MSSICSENSDLAAAQFSTSRRPSMLMSETQMEKICSKAPQSWRKPRSRIYDYNRELGYDYYMPMIDYVVSKENQGSYHLENPYRQGREKVHMPDTTDLADKEAYGVEGMGVPDLNEFLIKGYAKQIRERNVATANVHYHMLHGSKANTGFSRDNLLAQHVPANLTRNHWLRELMVTNNRQNMELEEKEREAAVRREIVEQRLAREEQEKWRNDPETIAWLRDGAKAATYWCHRTPLTREQRQARLEGRREEDPEVDLSKAYLY